MASTTYEQTPRYYYDQRAYPILWPAVCDHFANGGKMGHPRAVTARVRNAGQLPQPFWLSVLPVAAARVVLPAALQGLDRQQMTAAIKNAPLGRVDRKIALLRYVERLPLPDIAAQTHYSRTAIGYRLKGIDKILR